MLVRDNDRSNSTVILDVAADDEHDEAALAIEMGVAAKQLLPGALGIVYDTALRGSHIRIFARHGLLTVCPITAAKNAGKTRHSSKRIEKQGILGAKSHTLHDGTECVHEFAYHGGQICEVVTDSAGKKQLVSLGDPHLEQRTGKKISTLYVRYDVTCTRHQTNTASGSGSYTFDLRWNLSGAVDDSDLKDPFNVAENIRALPPGGAKYTAAYGWRQTVENENNQSDARKYQRRGRSHSSLHNLFNELGVALVITGIAVQTHANGWQLAAATPPTRVLAA